MAENTSGTATHKAGLFDIRFIIAALMGIYGVILLLTSFFTNDTQLDRADGLNVNLVGGLGMIVVAILFALWARLRPIIVPDHVEKQDDSAH
jgi:hypothetical protein